MNKLGIVSSLLCSFVLCTGAGNTQGSIQEQANNSLNKSLSTVGQCVVVTVSSTGEKNQEYHAKIPGDKYSPDGDNTAMSLIEVTKRITDAVEKAKKGHGSSTITIQVETKVPDSKPAKK